MYEAAVAQVSNLASLSPPSTLPSDVEAEVRIRVFWYAHVYEGVNTGLRGGRLIFDDDDLDALIDSPPSAPPPMISSPVPPLPSPISPTFRSEPHSPPSGVPYSITQDQTVSHHSNPHLAASIPQGAAFNQDGPRHYDVPRARQHAHLLDAHLFSLPLQLSTVCRQAHTLLTGPKARRLTDGRAGVDERGMLEVWEGLDRCWGQFEMLRRNGAGGLSGVGSGEDVERFAGGWQVGFSRLSSLYFG